MTKLLYTLLYLTKLYHWPQIISKLVYSELHAYFQKCQTNNHQADTFYFSC